MWYLWVGDRGKSLLFQLVYGLLERSYQIWDSSKDKETQRHKQIRLPGNAQKFCDHWGLVAVTNEDLGKQFPLPCLPADPVWCQPGWLELVDNGGVPEKHIMKVYKIEASVQNPLN